MKNSKKVIIIIAILIMILLISGGVFAYVYMATDTFKTDKQLFFKYFEQITAKDGFIDQRIEEYYTKKIETPYENSGELTVDAKYPEESLGKIIDKVNELSIKFSGKTDLNNRKIQRNVEVDYGNDVTFPVAYKQDGDKFGIQIEEISKQFIGIKNENLQEFVKKFEIGEFIEIPNKIEFTEIKNEYVFSEEDLKQLKKIYGGTISQQLTDENFSKGKIDKSDSYTLEMSFEQIKNINIKMLEKTKENTLILDKINEIILKQDPEAEKLDADVIDDVIEDIQEDDYSYIPNIKLTLVENNKKINKIIIQYGINQISIEKSEISDGVIYNVNFDGKTESEENSIIEDISNDMQSNLYFSAQYNGLAELKNIKENYKFGFYVEYDEDVMKYDYEINSNTEFKDSISIEDLSDDKTVFLNNREGSQIVTFLTNLGNRIIEINKNQMEELGLKEYENPLIMFIPIRTFLTDIIIDLDERVEDTSTSISEYDKQVTNAKFEKFVGTNISGSEVNALLSMVYNHNMSQEDITTMVKVVDKTNQNVDINPNENMTTYPNKVSIDNRYKVRPIYSDEGYITEIEISFKD